MKLSPLESLHQNNPFATRPLIAGSFPHAIKHFAKTSDFPDLWLFECLKKFDLMVTNRSYKENCSEKMLMLEVKAFMKSIKQNRPGRLIYFLHGQVSFLQIIFDPAADSVIKLELLPCFPIEDKLLQDLRSRDIEIKGPGQIYRSDIIDALFNEKERLPFILASIDEMLVGKERRFSMYGNDEMLSDLKYQIDRLTSALYTDHNPYCPLTYYLGDGYSKLILQADHERINGKREHFVRFIIETNSPEVTERARDLSDIGLLDEALFVRLP